MYSGCRFVLLVLGLGAFVLAGCPEELPAPICDFSATPVSGVAPFTVNFTNTSDYGGLAVAHVTWVFGDGSSGIAEHPTHTYTTPGRYSVFLSVSTRGGEAQVLRENLINVEAPTPPQAPVCNFDATPEAGVAPLTVTFVNVSDLGGETLSQAHWLFGDGGSSTDENPAHTYAQPGTYNVHLHVTTTGGTAELLREGFVTVEMPAGTVPPTIHLLGAAETHLECGNPYFDAGTVAFDYTGTEIPVEATPDPINTLEPGTYTIVYRAVDDNGLMASPVTRKIIIADTTPPVVDLEETFFVAECGTHSNIPGGTAFDTCAGALDVTLLDAVELDTAGFAVARYEAMDPSGNVGSVSLLVAIEDTTAPLLTLLGGNATVPYGGAYQEQGYLVTESCDQYPQVKYSPAAIDTRTIGARERTYYAIDADGNRSAELTRSIGVVPPCEDAPGWSREVIKSLGTGDMGVTGLHNCGLLVVTSTCANQVCATTLYRFTGDGDIAWVKGHELGWIDEPKVVELPSGEFVLVAREQPTTISVPSVPFAAQFSADGDLLAYREDLLDGLQCHVSDVIALPNDEVLISTYSYSRSGYEAPRLTRIKPPFEGAVWFTDLYDLNLTAAWRITATSDGNLVLVGRQLSNTNFGIVMKLDANGNFLWQQIVDWDFLGLGPNSRSHTEITCVASGLDGGCIVAGHIWHETWLWPESVFACAFDADGNSRWTTTLVENGEEAADIVRLLNGEYAFTVRAFQNTQDQQLILGLINPNGEVRTQTYHESVFQEEGYLAPLRDGGLARCLYFRDAATYGIQTFSLEELQHWGE